MQLDVGIQDIFGDCPVDDETWGAWFRHWLAALENHLPMAGGYEVTLRLTDDGEIRDLNRTYRHRDRPTDVLAFAALETPGPRIEGESLYLGDIVISVETAARQATERQHSLSYELAWLAAHGLLHLLGWDHPDDDSLERMLREQDRLLSTLPSAPCHVP